MGVKKGIKQGYYEPVNKQKWIITESFDSNGEKKIKYRSSWELKFMKFCDFNDSILQCNSEGIVIPYISPLDNKVHRYYMDFVIKTKNKTFLVEIKPLSQTKPPKPPKNKNAKSMKNYQKAIMTYAVNMAKWDAAYKFCQEKGWEFKIITEKELNIK